MGARGARRDCDRPRRCAGRGRLRLRQRHDHDDGDELDHHAHDRHDRHDTDDHRHDDPHHDHRDDHDHRDVDHHVDNDDRRRRWWRDPGALGLGARRPAPDQLGERLGHLGWGHGIPEAAGEQAALGSAER
jgi:hypothetical protein